MQRATERHYFSLSADYLAQAICIKFIYGGCEMGNGRGYLFRLALEWASSEADRANNAFSGELTEKDDIVLRLNGTQLLKLPVPS